MAALVATPYPIGHINYAAPRGQDAATLEFERLQDISDTLPDGEVVGAMLWWPRADGHAIYRVTSDAPLTLQHVPYGDGWSVEPALLAGVDRAVVLSMLARRRALLALFAERSC